MSPLQEAVKAIQAQASGQAWANEFNKTQRVKVMLPAGSSVKVNGIPVKLDADTLVETVVANIPSLFHAPSCVPAQGLGPIAREFMRQQEPPINLGLGQNYGDSMQGKSC